MLFLEAVVSQGLVVSLSQSVSQGHFNEFRKLALQKEVQETKLFIGPYISHFENKSRLFVKSPDFL